MSDPSGKTVQIPVDRLKYLEYIEKNMESIVKEGVTNHNEKENHKKIRRKFGFKK